MSAKNKLLTIEEGEKAIKDFRDETNAEHRLTRCGKILGCKPKYVENTLREMYRKIALCDAVLNPLEEK